MVSTGVTALVAVALLPLVLVGCARAQELPPEQPLTYVAIGASDAVGVGVEDPATQGWVPQFGASLGSDTHVVNLGVSGSTLAQALREQVGPAVDAHPDVVTVWLAVNDINARVPLESYEADLDTLLGDLEPTGARVLVGNVPDLSVVAAYQGVDPAQLQAEVQRWNAVIDAVAARHGATVVDLYARWQEVAQHPEYLSADGFHPSADGYARLAEVFEEAYASRPAAARPA